MVDFAQAEQEALALGNRGPLLVDEGGRVDESILDAYWRTGFYVFEGVLEASEVAELQREFNDLTDRAPVSSDAAVDAAGRPALGDEGQRQLFRFVKPLTDPYGATDTTNSRYQVKMREPVRPPDAPAQVLLQIGGILQFSDATLRIYGHPGLMAVTEAVNGADFTPFTEVIWIKQARLGAAVSWHQDGTTHWNSPDLDAGTHGFNYMVNLYPTKPENALWVLPGTHKARQGKPQGHDGSQWLGSLGRRHAHAVQARRCRDLQPANRARLVPEYVRHAARDLRLRIPPPRFGGRRERLGAGTVRRRIHPLEQPHHCAGYRRPQSALPGRETLRLPAVRRRRTDPLQRGHAPRGTAPLPPARHRHLTWPRRV